MLVQVGGHHRQRRGTYHRAVKTVNSASLHQDPYDAREFTLRAKYRVKIHALDPLLKPCPFLKCFWIPRNCHLSATGLKSTNHEVPFCRDCRLPHLRCFAFRAKRGRALHKDLSNDSRSRPPERRWPSERRGGEVR